MAMADMDMSCSFIRKPTVATKHELLRRIPHSGSDHPGIREEPWAVKLTRSASL
jgi:hypothetical protein